MSLQDPTNPQTHSEFSIKSTDNQKIITHYELDMSKQKIKVERIFMYQTRLISEIPLRRLLIERKMINEWEIFTLLSSKDPKTWRNLIQLFMKSTMNTHRIDLYFREAYTNVKPIPNVIQRSFKNLRNLQDIRIYFARSEEYFR